MPTLRFEPFACATTDQACTNGCITAHPGGQAAV
jgi:hypothetical protein